MSLSHKSTIKTTIKSICPVPFSRIFVRKIFYKLLSKHLWHSLFLVKSHAFNIFLRTPLDGCILFYVKTSSKLQKPYCINFWWKYIKNESCKWYLGSKELNLMFLVVSRMRTLVLSGHFFACPIERNRLKSRAPGGNLSTPVNIWYMHSIHPATPTNLFFLFFIFMDIQMFIWKLTMVV